MTLGLKSSCRPTDELFMDEAIIEITRWRRYGNDRLYVGRPDGSSLGWWDLRADEAHPASDADQHALAAAVHDWKSTSGLPATPDEPAVDDAVIDTDLSSAVAAEALLDLDRPWLDLAANLPGEAARAQAVAAKQAAPGRTLLARALRVHTAERAWRIGADGEEKVAAQFDKVVGKDARWQFIHAVPVGSRGSDIDHLVVGPGGVFTVNAKNHPNAKIWVGGETFLVNGHRQQYVRNSRHEADRAGKLLSQACGFSVPVVGVIAVVNAIEVEIKTAPQGVHVVPRRQIAKWLLRHGDVLDDSRQAAVFEAARRSTTWQ
jgi:Nuclease-related domain